MIFSRHERKQFGDQKKGASTSTTTAGRSGRSGRMPVGYYRNLNNGIYIGEHQGSSNFELPTWSNNQNSGRARNIECNHARNVGSYGNNYNVQPEDQPGPSGLQNKNNLINVRRSSRKREKRYNFGTVTVTDESDNDTIKDGDVLCDGRSTAEIDDDPLSDCSWNTQINSTKKNKNHRKRTCRGQESMEISKKRRRQTTIKKVVDDANSAPYSTGVQDSSMTRTYVTRNRQLHLNHTSAQAKADSHARIGLRRSVQRTVNYNENGVSNDDNDDDEASNSSAKRKKTRKHDK